MIARNASDYVWKEIRGLHALLQFVDGKSVMQDVEIYGAAEHAYTAPVYKGIGADPIFSQYGADLRYIEAAVEYTDGAILLCAHVSNWGGTLGENSNSTNYYGLTPK